MSIGIIEPGDFSKRAEKRLSKIGKVHKYTKGRLCEFLKNKSIIFVRLGYYWDNKLLNCAPLLKYICSPTTGLNHLNLQETQKKGIEVLSFQTRTNLLANIRATPEHTFGLTLSLLRQYQRAFLNPKNNLWDRNKFKGYEIYEKYIGIIGYGRIGKILARYFCTFGAHVYFFDIKPYSSDKYARKTSSIEELIRKSEVILLCASCSQQNHKMINANLLRLFKDKYFINTARGELIDEKYLLKLIKENYFKGIALDVLSDENKQNNLREFLKYTNNRNLILTPHIAGATYESMRKTEEILVDLLLAKIQK